MQKGYVEHKGKVIKADSRFKHVMALALDPRTDYKTGIVRCITHREGDVKIKGYTDRSELYKVAGDETLENFTIGERLVIQNEEDIISELIPPDWDFIGLEDPDIWFDEESGLTHVYFTIPIKPGPDCIGKTKIHLGHAVGADLDSLEMTLPVLLDAYERNAKEVSIAPINSKGVRYNLIESRDHRTDTTYSIIKVAIAKDMGEAWDYANTVFHPKEHSIPWIAGHASPGPLLPESFIDIGPGKRVGLINGREANSEVKGKTKYGTFSIGLCIYDFEHGDIEWVSPKPFIQDSKAKIITFASQFVETKKGEGIVYAHVDDSFVRAYTIHADAIKLLLPK